MAGSGSHLGQAGNGGVEVKRAGLKGVVRLLDTAQRKLLSDHGHLLLLRQILCIHSPHSMLIHRPHVYSHNAHMQKLSRL